MPSQSKCRLTPPSTSQTLLHPASQNQMDLGSKLRYQIRFCTPRPKISVSRNSVAQICPRNYSTQITTLPQQNSERPGTTSTMKPTRTGPNVYRACIENIGMTHTITMVVRNGRLCHIKLL